MTPEELYLMRWWDTPEHKVWQKLAGVDPNNKPANYIFIYSPEDD